jgi:tartrate dehydratase beta subunit/fumarate hydratase class I family protein
MIVPLLVIFRDAFAVAVPLNEKVDPVRFSGKMVVARQVAFSRISEAEKVPETEEENNTGMFWAGRSPTGISLVTPPTTAKSESVYVMLVPAG